MTPGPSDTRALQALGAEILGLLYGLSRSVVLYEPNNATVIRQADLLAERVARHALEVGEGIRLTLLADEFFLNGRLLRVDPATWERAAAVARFLDRFGIGELCLDPGLARADVLSLIDALQRRHRGAATGDVAAHHGALEVCRSSGRALASLDLRPDRLALLLCGSVLDLVEWIYGTGRERGASLLPLRRALQLAIDASARHGAVFQAIAFVRDPRRPPTNPRLRLAAAIDAVCFGHYLTLPRVEVLHLALASVLAGVSRAAGPEDAVRPLLGFRGYREAAVPVLLAVHDARRIQAGGQGGVPGQVLAVCEAFHALTSTGVNGSALAPAVALQVLLDGFVTGLDRGVVRVFADFKGPWPLGSLVSLSDGSVALVTGQAGGPQGKQRPQVVRWADGAFSGEVLDLREAPAVEIVGAPSPLDLGLDLAAT